MSDCKSEEHWLKKEYTNYFIKPNALHFYELSFVKECSTAQATSYKIPILRRSYVLKPVQMFYSEIRRNLDVFCQNKKNTL